MGTVLLVLVAMTAVGTAVGVIMTAPWLVRRDLQQPQQQQQAMISRMMNNRGPPFTAAFSISEKSYHRPKIPATKTHFWLKIDSTILWVCGNHIVGYFWIVYWVFFSICLIFCATLFGDWTRPQHQETSLKLYLLRSRTMILEKYLVPISPLIYKHDTENREKLRKIKHRRISVLLL